MKSKQALAGLALAAIAIVSFASPAFACIWRKEWKQTDWYVYFWVKSYAAGCDEGDYFSNYEHDWWHGPGSDPPPPWLFCNYDWERSRTYINDKLTIVTTHSWGIITEKATGEFVDRIDATAEVDAREE